ncbi:unnamed protein product [Prunus brigantina]
MPGLDPKVVVHHLTVKPGTSPIKQTQHHFRPELLGQIKAEVDKLITTGFIKKLYLSSEELTALRTSKGIYCYKVMPFGLKNAGATYQRAMQKIFGDMLYKNFECYVDDLVIKSIEEKIT